MNVASVIIGLLCLALAIIGLVPLLGWLNWFVLPGTAIGILIGMLSDKRAGAILNVVVLVIALARLFIGGGVL